MPGRHRTDTDVKWRAWRRTKSGKRYLVRFGSVKQCEQCSKWFVEELGGRSWGERRKPRYCSHACYFAWIREWGHPNTEARTGVPRVR